MSTIPPTTQKRYKDSFRSGHSDGSGGNRKKKSYRYESDEMAVRTILDHTSMVKSVFGHTTALQRLEAKVVQLEKELKIQARIIARMEAERRGETGAVRPATCTRSARATAAESNHYQNRR